MVSRFSIIRGASLAVAVSAGIVMAANALMPFGSAVPAFREPDPLVVAPPSDATGAVGERPLPSSGARSTASPQALVRRSPRKVTRQHTIAPDLPADSGATAQEMAQFEHSIVSARNAGDYRAAVAVATRAIARSATLAAPGQKEESARRFLGHIAASTAACRAEAMLGTKPIADCPAQSRNQP